MQSAAIAHHCDSPSEDSKNTGNSSLALPLRFAPNRLIAAISGRFRKKSTMVTRTQLSGTELDKATFPALKAGGLVFGGVSSDNFNGDNDSETKAVCSPGSFRCQGAAVQACADDSSGFLTLQLCNSEAFRQTDVVRSRSDGNTLISCTGSTVRKRALGSQSLGCNAGAQGLSSAALATMLLKASAVF